MNAVPHRTILGSKFVGNLMPLRVIFYLLSGDSRHSLGGSQSTVSQVGIMKQVLKGFVTEKDLMSFVP